MPFSSKFSSGTRCVIGFGEKALGGAFAGSGTVCVCVCGEEVIIAFVFLIIAKNGGVCDAADKEG